jgi:NADH:ubiquinone oxidoreductase subunit C
MYGIFFSNKKDHRKLLLDYSSFENPLLKDFPLEGNKQVFFSFFENQVVVQNNKFIEI